MTGQDQPPSGGQPPSPIAGPALRPPSLEVAPRCARCGAPSSAPAPKECPECGSRPSPVEARANTGLAAEIVRAQDILRGAAYLARGFWVILSRRSLWSVVALPLLLNIVFVLGTTEFAVPAVRSWLRWSTAPGSLATWTGWWDAPAFVVALLGYSLRAFPSFIVPVMVACLLSTPPFRVMFAALSTLISEQVERQKLHEHGLATTSEYVRREQSFSTAILSSLVLTVLEILVYLVTFPLALLPFAGTLAWVILPRMIVSGMDLVDPTLCRKAYSARERARLFWAHRYKLLGFGTPFFLPARDAVREHDHLSSRCRRRGAPLPRPRPEVTGIGAVLVPAANALGSSTAFSLSTRSLRSP